MMNEKETIIKSTLKYLVKMQIEEGGVGFAVDNDPDHDCCWDDVLAWLEAQPSEDCISRQKALDCFEQTNTRQGAKYAIETLPSEKPQRPKGKWIKVITNKDDFGETWHFKCSICGEKSNKGYRPLENYCHNCGAEMGGADETN